jgi:hypothetical protein
MADPTPQAMKGSWMTALRNIANTPPLLRHAMAPTDSEARALFRRLWSALQRFGQLRAAHQLALLAEQRVRTDPVLACQLRTAAAECRRAARVNEGAKS